MRLPPKRRWVLDYVGAIYQRRWVEVPPGYQVGPNTIIQKGETPEVADGDLIVSLDDPGHPFARHLAQA